MEYRQLGESNIKVSSICLGTMTFGEQNTESDAHAQLDYAMAHGINFIDTAEMYPVPPRAHTYGMTETFVGSWLRKQRRDQLVIATKVAGPSRGLAWIRGGPVLDRKQITAAIEASLKRLQTDYVDLYQLHWPERNVPMFGGYTFDPANEHEATSIHEQLEILSGLIREGKVRAVGLSNEHPWGVMEFLRIAREQGLARIVSTQNACNLLNRVYEYGLAETCFRERVSLLAYSPLAFGYLTGKYAVDAHAKGRVTQFSSFGQRYSKANVKPAVAHYIDIAKKHARTPTQLALSWIYHRWYTTSSIIGATTVDQLRENIAAWDITLSDEVRADIEAAHLRYTNPAP